MFGAGAVYPAAWWLSMLELPEGQQSQTARGRSRIGEWPAGCPAGCGR